MWYRGRCTAVARMYVVYNYQVSHLSGDRWLIWRLSTCCLSAAVTVHTQPLNLFCCFVRLHRVLVATLLVHRSVDSCFYPRRAACLLFVYISIIWHHLIRTDSRNTHCAAAPPAYCLPPGQIVRPCVRTRSWLPVSLCRYCDSHVPFASRFIWVGCTGKCQAYATSWRGDCFRHHFSGLHAKERSQKKPLFGIDR